MITKNQWFPVVSSITQYDEKKKAFLFRADNPESYFQVKYNVDRNGADVVYDLGLRFLPLNTSTSGLPYQKIYCDVWLNGNKVINGRQITSTFIWDNRTSQPLNISLPSASIQSTATEIPYKIRLYMTNDKWGDTDISYENTVEVPRPQSSVSFTDFDPTTTKMVVENLAGYTCSIKCGNLYWNGSAWGSTENKSLNGTYSNVYSEQFVSPSSLNKTVTFTVTTYSGGTKISEYTQSVEFRLPQEKSKPTLTHTEVDTNTNITDLTGDSSKIVLNASILQCSATATGAYGATISSTKVRLNSSQTTYAVPHNFSKPTENKVVYVVTDSRGGTYEYSFTVPTINYNYPTITANVSRMGSEDTVSVQITGSWTAVNFGFSENRLRLRYKLRELNGEWPSSWTSLTTTVTGNNFSYTGEISGVEYIKEYEIQFNVYDLVRNTSTDAIYIPKSVPIADWGENDWHFHCPVQISTDNESPFLINGLDIIERLQYLENLIKSYHPAPSPTPTPTTPDPISSGTLPFNAGTTLTWGPYDTMPTRLRLISEHYDQFYYGNVNYPIGEDKKICGVGGLQLHFDTNNKQITLYNGSGGNWKFLESTVYFN